MFAMTGTAGAEGGSVLRHGDNALADGVNVSAGLGWFSRKPTTAAPPTPVVIRAVAHNTTPVLIVVRAGCGPLNCRSLGNVASVALAPTNCLSRLAMLAL